MNAKETEKEGTEREMLICVHCRLPPGAASDYILRPLRLG